ncbi:MAG: ATP-binding protein [Bacteroidetes bacterium]|nr:ATP-binding protein [Bacteroidota bacterium]
MLSFKKGQTIAKIIFKEKKKDKDIKLEEDMTDLPQIVPKNLDELIPKSFYSGLRSVSSINLILLKKAIRTQNRSLLPGTNRALQSSFDTAKELLTELCKKNLYIPPSEGSIECVPLQESSRIAVLGPSGVGKSTWTGNFLKQYHQKYKMNKIYIFSPIDDDNAFKGIPLEYIRLDQSTVDDPMDIAEFYNSICVFDDVESIKDKAIKEAIQKFMDICLETGRHKNITTLCVSHIILNGPSTKRMLNESDQVVVFPRSNFNAIKNLCVRYYGFDKDTINYLKDIGQRSRWAVIRRSYPTCIISSNNVRVV